MENTRLRILVPVDGSECSLQALDFAVDLAVKLRGDIVVCHVIDLARAAVLSGGEGALVAGCLAEVRNEAGAILEEAVKRAGARVPVSQQTAVGDPVAEIRHVASTVDAAFVVMGSHGRNGLSRLLMGSVAEGVVRGSAVPVMVVPVEGSLAGARI